METSASERATSSVSGPNDAVRARSQVLLVSAIFFGSGAAALIFQNLWFRQTSLVFGNSIWASSLVLASFMGGLGLGNWLTVRFGTRVARPLFVYAVLELGIAVVGLALVLLLPRLTELLVPVFQPFLEQPQILNPLRLLLAFCLLLLPTTAMGATLPLVVQAFAARGLEFGPILGRFYALNTLGALAGTLVVEVLLVPSLGIRGSAYVGALLGVAVFASASAVSLRAGRLPDARPTEEAPDEVGPLGAVGIRLMVAAFLSGFLLLALEVVWFRLMLLFVVGTTTSFAVMLAVVLAGIGIGGALAGRRLVRSPDSHRALPAVALLSGLASVVVYASFSSVLGDAKASVYYGRWVDVLRLGFPLIFPVSLLSGALFTWTGSALRAQCGGAVQTAGLLTLANTVGAMFGSLVAGFVLLPTVGIEATFFIVAVGYGAVALLTVPRGMRFTTLPQRAIGMPALVLFLAGIAAFPWGLMDNQYIRRSYLRFMADGSVPIDTREGLLDTIVYMKKEVYGRPTYYRLVTNGFSMSATGMGERYQKLYIYIPTALRPEPKSALQISFGVGATARSLVATKSFETIDIVDVSRDNTEMSRHVLPDEPHPLDDPRVTLHIEDGRYFLQTSNREFDLITADPPPPKVASIVNLYTKEYFQLIEDRLAPGGVASYWLAGDELLWSDGKAIVRAFCEVFEDCTLWNGNGLNWSMVGTKGLEGAPTVEAFTRQFRDPEVGPEMRRLGVEVPGQIGALFIADAPWILEHTKDTPPLVDNYPARLSPEYLSVAADVPLFAEWMDVTGTRERFLESDFIREHLPPSIREESLRYFPLQQMLNEYFMRDLDMHERFIAAVSGLRRDLRTFPLWMLGARTDTLAQIQEAYEQDGVRDPYAHNMLGIQACVDGDHERAEEHYVASLALDPAQPELNYYRLFNFALAGDVAAFDALRAEVEGTVLVSPSEDAAFYDVLRQAFPELM